MEAVSQQKAGDEFLVILSDLVGPQHTPDFNQHRERIRLGFGFSRWFILTYQAAVIAILLLATATRLYRKWARRQRLHRRTLVRNRAGSDERVSDHLGPVTGPCSGSENDALPPSDIKAQDEGSPLLGSSLGGRRAGRLLPKLRSILMYQPAPLPVLNRTMPSNGGSLMIAASLGLNLFYLFVRIDGIDVLSDRAGLLFAANLPWLYVLASKNNPIQVLTGHSYENLNILHRRLGELLCILAVIHSSGMVVLWYQFLRPIGVDLVRFLSVRYILFGIMAFVAYEVLYFTSLATVRKLWYEVFLGSHIFLQAAGLVLLYLHHFRGRPYVAVSLAIFLVDRLIFRLGLKFGSFNADLKVFEDNETILVSANWPIRSRWHTLWTSVASYGMTYGWQPTEHVFISVPRLGKKYAYQFHPITIASAAPTSQSTHAWFNLIIRAKDGFSKDLLHFAQKNALATIRLDGPYGSSHALEMLRGSDQALVVAGGSGIAVAYPLVWSLLHAQSAAVEAGVQTPAVCLIWIVQDASHLDWIGPERLDELKVLGLRVVIPGPTRKHGRPDVASILEATLMAKSYLPVTAGPKIGVVVSGPDELNRSVRNICSQRVRGGLDIDVVVEKFGW